MKRFGLEQTGACFSERSASPCGPLERSAPSSWFDVRTFDVHDRITTLSGGNAQKVIVAREMSRPLAVLVASQPTRGVDVGSIEFIYRQMVAERDRGTAVLLISSELDEIDALADRIAIMYRGRLVGIVPAGTPREVLGLMMAGVPFEEATAQQAGGVQ